MRQHAQEEQWALNDGGQNNPPAGSALSIAQEPDESVEGDSINDNTFRNESAGENICDQYSGFATVLKKLGEGPHDPDRVEKELNWQKLSKTDPAAFKATVLSTFTFRAFALMPANSPYITLCHSIGQFCGEPGDENKGLHGQCIAFVGDRKIDRDPMVVILPNKAWEWTQPFINGDTAELEEYYEPGNGNDATFFIAPAEARDTASTTKARGKQGKQGATGTSTDAGGTTDATASKGQNLAVPFMLSLPTTIFEELIRKPYQTPVDLMEIVGAFRDNYDLQIEYTSWTIMTDWCIAATQVSVHLRWTLWRKMMNPFIHGALAALLQQWDYDQA